MSNISENGDHIYAKVFFLQDVPTGCICLFVLLFSHELRGYMTSEFLLQTNCDQTTSYILPTESQQRGDWLLQIIYGIMKLIN